MANSLFVVNGVDLTTHIVAPTYIMNELNVYEEWTDANKVNHRDVIRTRVTGSFDVYIDNETDFNTFVNMIENKSGGDYITATVYINNKDTTDTRNFFITCELPNIVPMFGRQPIDPISVELEEA